MMQKFKKTGIIAGIVFCGLFLIAITIGILNALVGNGEWTLGWSDYRYEESDYQIGEGSIPSKTLTSIEVDWIDGEVEIVACQDAYISLTEQAENALPESARLRWKISEDGTTLSVKYRKSSWFFSLGSGSRDKKLILRVPESMLSQITLLDVETESGNVELTNLFLPTLAFQSKTGSLTIENSALESISAQTVRGSVSMSLAACPRNLSVSTEYSDVTLKLPENASFSLEWERDKGTLSTDFTLTQSANSYICQNGDATFYVKTQRGDLILVKHRS